MKFEFATATRIIFGRGTIQQVGALATEMGSSSFVLVGKTNERAEPLLEQLEKNAIKYTTFSVPSEPTTTIVKEAVRRARQADVDLVIGIGGGSVIDAGKAVAAMLTNKGRLEEYLEVVGDGKPITQNPPPYIAIPTTAGTGAEVTRNAVIGVPDPCLRRGKHAPVKTGVKVSMRSPLMLPRVALIDPALTDSMPQDITASTGLDALTQLIEAYVSNKSNPLTDGICREGIKRAGRSLRKAYKDGSDKTARDNMALAGLFSGLALANAKLGAVHGFAGPLGGMVTAPHGVICARFLPVVCRVNVKALKTRQPDSPSLTRYGEIAQLLTGKSEAKAADGVAWLQELCAELKVPSLTEFGLTEEDFPEVVAKAKKSSSMKGNPIELTDDELMEILKEVK